MKKNQNGIFERDTKKFMLAFNNRRFPIEVEWVDEVIKLLNLDKVYLQMLDGLYHFALRTGDFKFKNVKIDELMSYIYRRQGRILTPNDKIEFCKVLDEMNRMYFELETKDRGKFIYIWEIVKVKYPSNGETIIRSFYDEIIEAYLLRGIEYTGLRVRDVSLLDK